MIAKLAGLGFIVIGAALLVTGIYYAYERLDFLGRCLETRAVVVDTYWEEGCDSDTGPYQIAFPVLAS